MEAFSACPLPVAICSASLNDPMTRELQLPKRQKTINEAQILMQRK